MYIPAADTYIFLLYQLEIRLFTYFITILILGYPTTSSPVLKYSTMGPVLKYPTTSGPLLKYSTMTLFLSTAQPVVLF